MSASVSRKLLIGLAAIQIVQLLVICVLGVRAYSSPSGGQPIYALVGQTVPTTRLDEARSNPDALKLAYDVGVLEVLSIGVTFFTVVLAIAAFFGFWMIRGAAVRAAEVAAKIEAKEQSEKISERISRRYLEEKAPELVVSVLKSKGLDQSPNIGLTAEQVQEVTSDATEIGPNHNGHE